MINKRNLTFDIAKGLAIILIVLGHIRGTNTPSSLACTISFINYFHVAVFFIISGYFSSPHRNWKYYVSKKAKRLVLPYIISNIIFLICEVIIVYLIIGRLQIPTISYIARAFIGIDPVWLAIPAWFLMTLFYISIFYKLILNILRNDVVKTLVFCLILSIVSYIVQQHSSVFGIVFITRTALALGFFAIGHFAKERIMESDFNIGTGKLSIMLFISLSILLLMFFIFKYRVDYFWQKGYSLVAAYISGISGSIMILSASRLIELFPTIVKKAAAYIGQSSMYILLGHYPVFLLISVMQSKLLGSDLDTILSSICPAPGHGWWIIYLVAGTTVPLLVKMALSRIKGSE